MSFESLGLAESLVRAVHDKGYTQPTPIQTQAIPAILQGQDIMAAAQTGTGKTAGFTLPLLQRLLPGQPVKANGVRALVLTPTRELAAQVYESVQVYGENLPLRSTVVFGGVSINPQMKNLRRGVDVLVATPGRLLDLHKQNAVKLNQVEILVLDEADRMLDMGFIHDIKRVLALLPAKRQNLLFSATFSGDIRELARGLLNNPVEIDVAPRNSTTELVEQVVHPVDKGRKAALLSHLIKSQDWTQAIVFSRTKHGANRLVDYLMEDGISAAAIHSNKSQGARTKALSEFKNGKVSILVATDIAARGLDIPQLPQVVNFDLPNVPEDYVHRIGRTGRAGETGHAISLVSADESRQLADIERLIKRKITREEITGFEAKQTVAEARAEEPQRRNESRGGGRSGQQRQGQQRQGQQRQGQERQGQSRSGEQRSSEGRNRAGANGGQRQGEQRAARADGQRSQKPRNGQSSGGRGQGEQRQAGGGRNPQGRTLSHVDKALINTPMSQRLDPSEEHRRAQALGNRAPTPQEREAARQAQPRQNNGRNPNARGADARTDRPHQNRARNNNGGQRDQGNGQRQAAPRSADAPPKKIAGVPREKLGAAFRLMTPLLLAAILAGLVAVAPFAIDTYLPALPMMAGDLNAPIALVQASIPAYLIGGAIGQFVGGPLSDQIGRKPVGLFGLTVYGLSSCAIAFTNSVEMLLLLRFTQALGGGSTTVIVAAIVRDSQDGKSSARMMALIGLIMTSAPLVAPAVGSGLLWLSGWRAIFVMLALYALLMFILLKWRVPETRQPNPDFSLGHLLRTTLHNYGVVFRHRRALGYVFGMGFGSATMFMFLSTSAFAYMEYFGASEQQFPLLFGANIVAMMIMNRLGVLGLRWLEPEILCRIGISALLLAMLGLAVYVLMGDPQLNGVVLFIMAGLGMMGLMYPQGIASYLHFFPQQAGAASALLGILQFTLGALSGAIVNALHDGSLVPMAVGMATTATISATLLFGLAGLTGKHAN